MRARGRRLEFPVVGRWKPSAQVRVPLHERSGQRRLGAEFEAAGELYQGRGTHCGVSLSRLDRRLASWPHTPCGRCGGRCRRAAPLPVQLSVLRSDVYAEYAPENAALANAGREVDSWHATKDALREVA